jgi:3-hydroxyisobutyrate dehydrogenase-like beta-hydroxyacid dehydrogenase
MAATLPRLGFIGVGAMGLPMARNLLRAGYSLAFCTSRDAAAMALGAAGGERLADAAAVAAACDVLLTCLPADAEIAAVLLGEAGALAALRPGATIIELSTASPDLMRALAEAGASRGIALLDAPVSGGVGGAEAASLAIMVGGDAATLERHRPILAALGQQIYHVGPVGMGKVFKLCNQYLNGATTALVGEALTLGAKAGADPALLVEVISASSGASRALTGAAPALFAATPPPVGFRLDLMRKDVGLALALGNAVGAPLATGAVAHQLYTAASASGLGGRNHTELGKLVAQLAGFDLAASDEATGDPA